MSKSGRGGLPFICVCASVPTSVQVLVVSRGFNDVMTFDISCAEVDAFSVFEVFYFVHSTGCQFYWRLWKAQSLSCMPSALQVLMSSTVLLVMCCVARKWLFSHA